MKTCTYFSDKNECFSVFNFYVWLEALELLEVGIKRNFGGAIRTKAHSAQIDFTVYALIIG